MSDVVVYLILVLVGILWAFTLYIINERGKSKALKVILWFLSTIIFILIIFLWFIGFINR